MTNLGLRAILLIVFTTFHLVTFSQSKYKVLVKAAMDSSALNKPLVAVNLLLKAKALKGIDTNYSERINMHLGSNYETLNKIDSSIYYYGEAVKYCEQKKDLLGLSFLYSRLGNIELTFTGRYKSAINYFNKQLVAGKILKDSINIFDCLNNLGLSYKSANQYNTALLYFNKVTTNQSVYNRSKNTALLFTADTYSMMKKYPLALQYYDEALESLIKTGDSSAIYAAYANKGDCLMQQNRLMESITSLKKAQQYINSSITNKHKAVLYHNFAEAYSKQQNFDKAFYFKNLENVTKDSINTESIGKAIAEMSAKYELRKKQDSLYINKQKLILADARTKENQRNFIILLVVSLTGVILLLGMYQIRQLRFNNSLQQKQAEQNALKLTHKYQLSESELKAIRSQMNPHFIFNVLNSIEAYIMENDKRTASRLIQKFASLSRLILENSTKRLVPADKEWKSLMLYTELEAMRFSNAFTYNFQVEDEILLKKLILPPMLIQPLIENAILHGLIVDPRPDAHLEVQMKKFNGNICITVEDNGIGIGNSRTTNTRGGVKEKSIGLASIRERIEILNNQENDYTATFDISSRSDSRGTIATVCLSIFEKLQVD
jgi:tetratricopeptide (TPR) repeat protein